MRLIVAWALLASSASPARAAYEEAPPSARAAAMGGAWTAVNDDPAAAAYNPAALAGLRRPAAVLGYSRVHNIPSGAVDQDRLGLFGSLPLGRRAARGALGMAITHVRENDFGLERQIAFGGAGRSVWETDYGALDAGGTLKFLKKSFSASPSAGTQAAIDLGAVFRFSERYAAGLAILNFNRPTFTGGGRGEDRAPAAIKLGVSESMRGLTLALDLTKREPSGGHPGTATLAAGLERWWALRRLGSVAGRTGLSLGDRNKTWNWGLAWKFFGGELGYAMTIPLSGRSLIGHAVNLGFRFGESNPEREYESVLAEEVNYRRRLTEALEAAESQQWRLSEELSRLREELAMLQSQLVDKTASEGEARRRLRAIDERHRRAVETFEKLKGESKRLAEKSQQAAFREDWESYRRLKLGGSPDSLLTDQIKRLLRQYKGTPGVDLSEANQELIRLLKQ